MKLYLICAFLLAMPLAFAETPLSFAKVIFDHNHVLVDTKENFLLIRNGGGDLWFGFDDHVWLNIKDVVKKGRANLILVAEAVRMADGSRYSYFDCLNGTEESLRHLIYDGQMKSCYGAARLRNLTKEEFDQMEKFKSNPEQTSKKFQVFYDKGNLKIKSFGLTEFQLERQFKRLKIKAEEGNYEKTGWWELARLRTLSLFRFEDKSLVAEGSETTVDCFDTEVENLLVADCEGDIVTRNPKDDDKI